MTVFSMAWKDRKRLGNRGLKIPVKVTGGVWPSIAVVEIPA